MNRQQVSAYIVGLLAALVVTTASTAGTITGQITDKDTGEPLPGVNVVVKGTARGGATDLDGVYRIIGLSAGYYDLQASFVGYKVALRTAVRMPSDNAEVEIDIPLEPTVLAIGQEVTIIGQKPLLDVDETATARTLSSADIEDLAVEGIDDLLAQQVGVVSDNNEIHIRGGRADENLYIIDNVSVKDPISGQGLGIYLSADAIKELEVITGGFNAEYGEAMSGLVNVETKEGGERFDGTLALKTDNIMDWPPDNQNTGNLEFSLGGPEPITNFMLPSLGVTVPGKVSFFLNGYGYASNTYLPSNPVQLTPYKAEFDDFALREENNWSLLGKVTWKPTDVSKISYSYGRSLRINQGYFDALVEDKTYFPLEYRYILDDYNTITREGIQQSVNWTHTLSTSTFYEVTLGNFYNRVHSGAGRLHYSEYKEPIDVEPVFYYPQPNGEMIVKYGDGYWDNGNGSVYHDHFNETWQLRAKMTSQVHERHKVKLGLEYEQTLMQLFNIHDPWVASTEFGGDYDMYRAMSESGAFFVQDKVEFKGMIANIGLRMDWWAPGQYVEDAINDPRVITLTDQARQTFKDETTDMLGRRVKMHLSPRLGISHPVTDSDVLFFSYGHFSQRPKYAYVYSKLHAYSPSTYQLFGNPNLNPQTTVAYEMGVKHRFTGDQVIEFVAFYKDLFDYATSFNVKSTNPRLGSISYYQYFNIDYARVRGVEVRFRARQGRYLTGTAEFAYQIATGKSSSANAEILAAADTRITEKTLGEDYLAWDKPITVGLTLWLRVREGDAPDWFGLRWPERWGGSVRLDVQSGRRYTPGKLVNNRQDIQETGDQYSAISETWNTVDVKLWKEWDLYKDATFRVFAEVQNLFDYRIPRAINPLTGEPYTYGDPYPLYWENPQGFVPVDPSDWREPRQAFLGVNFRF